MSGNFRANNEDYNNLSNNSDVENDGSIYDKIPFMGSSNQNNNDPKKESFGRMLYISFCPKLKLVSLTSIIIGIIFLLFIIPLASYGIYISPTSPLLQQKISALSAFGCMNQQYLADGEIYRLISAIFLHTNFLHIFFNSLAIFSLLSTIERSYGPIRAALIFLVCGIGGNIFSACVSHYSPYTFSAGASTSISGLLGCWISFIILNWKSLGVIFGEQMRCFMICLVFIQSMFIWGLSSYGMASIVVAQQKISVDSLGHFGGFLTGILMGLFVPKPLQESQFTKNCKLVGITLFSMFFFLSFLLFYTATVP